MTRATTYQYAVGCYMLLVLAAGIAVLVAGFVTSTTCGFRWSVEPAYLSADDGGSGAGVDDLGYGVRRDDQLRLNEYTTSVLSAAALIIYAIGSLVTLWGSVNEKSQTATGIYGDTLRQIRDRFTVSNWIIWGIVFPIHFATASFAAGIRDPWHVAALAVLAGTSIHYLQSHNEAMNSASTLLYDDQMQPLTGGELDDRLLSIEKAIGNNEAWVLALVYVIFVAADWFTHLVQNERQDGFHTCAEWIPIGTIIVYALLHIVIFFVTNRASSNINAFDRQAPFLIAALLIFGGTTVLQLTCASAQACPNAAAT